MKQASSAAIRHYSGILQMMDAILNDSRVQFKDSPDIINLMTTILESLTSWNQRFQEASISISKPPKNAEQQDTRRRVAVLRNGCQ